MNEKWKPDTMPIEGAVREDVCVDNPVWVVGGVTRTPEEIAQDIAPGCPLLKAKIAAAIQEAEDRAKAALVATIQTQIDTWDTDAVEKTRILYRDPDECVEWEWACAGKKLLGLLSPPPSSDASQE